MIGLPEEKHVYPHDYRYLLCTISSFAEPRSIYLKYGLCQNFAPPAAKFGTVNWAQVERELNSTGLLALV
jgi:hypothetical protein